MNPEALKEYIVPLIRMVLTLVIGHVIAAYLVRLLKKALGRSKTDPSLADFLAKTLNIVMHVLIILSALSSIGISTTGILAALSAAAVGIAVALKDSLSNVAGGILLLIAPRFSTGDFIEAGGQSGTVLHVDLIHTTIKTPDHKQVSIPNGLLVNNEIINYSREPKRRVDITFSVAYEADAQKAKAVIQNVIRAHELTLSEPEPEVRVISYGDSAVNIVSRTWCLTENYWTVFFDLTENVRTALEAEGIPFPYNQLDVHIKN